MSPPANWSDLAQPRPVGDRRPPFTLPGFGACRGAWRRCSAPCDVTSVRVDRAGSRAGEAARGDFDVFLRRAATHRKRGVGSRSRAGPVEVDVRDGHLVNPWVDLVPHPDQPATHAGAASSPLASSRYTAETLPRQNASRRRSSSTTNRARPASSALSFPGPAEASGTACAVARHHGSEPRGSLMQAATPITSQAKIS
jgi:hypothetical protein